MFLSAFSTAAGCCRTISFAASTSCKRKEDRRPRALEVRLTDRFDSLCLDHRHKPNDKTRVVPSPQKLKKSCSSACGKRKAKISLHLEWTMSVHAVQCAVCACAKSCAHVMWLQICCDCVMTSKRHLACTSSHSTRPSARRYRIWASHQIQSVFVRDS